MQEDPTGFTPWLVWVVIFMGGGLGGCTKYLLYRYRRSLFYLVRDATIGVVAAFVGVLVFPFGLGKTITHNLLLQLFGFSLLAGVAGKQFLVGMQQEFLEDHRSLAHKEYNERLDEFGRRLKSPSRARRRKDK